MTFISRVKPKDIPNFAEWKSNRIPKADIWEKENQIEIEVELPGIPQKDIEISYKNGDLTIEVKKTTEKSEKIEDYEYSEFENISFYRSFTIEDEIEEEKIKAKLENGLLRVSIPLKLSPRKQISIN